MQRLQSFGGLAIMFSKFVTVAENRSSLVRMVFNNFNPLIYNKTTTASTRLTKRSFWRTNREHHTVGVDARMVNQMVYGFPKLQY